MEARQFDEHREEFERRNVRIVGMSPDHPADLKRFRDKYDLHFTFVSDPDHSTLEAYGAWGERPGRGPGVIRSTLLIAPDGTVERAWYGVKPDGHAQEVIAALGTWPVAEPLRGGTGPGNGRGRTREIASVLEAKAKE